LSAVNTQERPLVKLLGVAPITTSAKLADSAYGNGGKQSQCKHGFTSAHSHCQHDKTAQH